MPESQAHKEFQKTSLERLPAKGFRNLIAVIR